MKNILILLIISLSTFLFSGCFSNINFVKYKNGDNIAVSTKKDNPEIYIYQQVGKRPLKDYLQIAAKAVLAQGKPYFALNSAGVSNFNGFPINNYKELLRYSNLHEKNKMFTTTGSNMGIGNRPLRNRSGGFELVVIPLGAEYKDSFISVWDAKQTLEDTK